MKLNDLPRILPPWAETLRQRLFATPLDALATLVCLYIIWRISVPLIEWLLIDATWNGTTREDCRSSGACWVFIRARFGQFMYGQYPLAERWRVDLLGLLIVGAAVALSWRGLPRHKEASILALIVLPPLGIWLLYGGWGLKLVETREWGGLMLTLFLAIYAGLIAVPLGILLALARAVIGLAFVIAAYMAEAVRGGLQALPDGQAEASQALGLGYWRTMRLIVLPQALRISLPAMTNEFIALFKNTTLVLIVSIFDLLGIAQAALADPAWVGMNMEAYVFAGAIYWFSCFGLSQWSRLKEKRLQTAYGR